MRLASLKRFGFGRQPRGTGSALAPCDMPIGSASAGTISCDGQVEEISPSHAQGWICDFSQPQRRMDYEIMLPDTGEVLATGRADQFGPGLAKAGIGDGTHAFWTRFGRTLNEEERSRIVVRVGNGQELARPLHTKCHYEPLLHVAMDIVDNCNLRCPFCIYDYEQTRATHFMTDETLDAALRFLPYARDGEFWFSCLHEPSLHPKLIDFIERVPAHYRRKLFYTTNLAKRMPARYFDWLAGNGMHHVNVSIESRDPLIYERMRKGARHRIFEENCNMLIAALDRTSSPTPVRYITMAYKSNLRELPGLTRYLLEERRASQVEIRHTFDVPYIPAEFRSTEFLQDADWDWLADQLRPYPPQQVQLLQPPRLPAREAPAAIPAIARPNDLLAGRVMFRLSWDGTVKVVKMLAASRDDAMLEKTVLETNIREITDPGAFFESLEARPESLATHAQP